MRRCVWSRNLVNEEAMAHVGPQRHRINKLTINVGPTLSTYIIIIIIIIIIIFSLNAA